MCRQHLLVAVPSLSRLTAHTMVLEEREVNFLWDATEARSRLGDKQSVATGIMLLVRQTLTLRDSENWPSPSWFQTTPSHHS